MLYSASVSGEGIRYEQILWVVNSTYQSCKTIIKTCKITSFDSGTFVNKFAKSD